MSTTEVRVLLCVLLVDVSVEALLRLASSSAARPNAGRARLAMVRGRSVSEPDIGDRSDIGLGASATEAVTRWRPALESCCCCRPLSVETEIEDGREKVTPFVCVELAEFVLLRAGPNSMGLSLKTFAVVAVVSAVVAFGGFMTGGSIDSARMVMLELVLDFLRSFLSSAEVVRRSRDSDGSVDSEGGMDMGASVRERSWFV